MNIGAPQYIDRMGDHGYAATDQPLSPGLPMDPEQLGRRRSSQSSALSSADSASGRLRSSQQRGVHFMEGGGNSSPMAVAPVELQQSQSSKAPMPSKELTAELDICSPSLTQSEISGLEEALAGLRELLQQTLSACSRSSGAAAMGQLLPLGSYAFGVICPGDTLDFVFSVPQHVVLLDLLQQLRNAFARSSEAMYLCDAGCDGDLQAPGLQLAWRGIKIMILLSRSIPDLPPASGSGIVQDTSGLFSRDVCDAILKSVTIHESFTQLLRFVRFWAKRRGIYGSDFGYFSGTAWAICCATVCQQHQRLQLPQLVGHFFRHLSRWDWTVPVAILPPDGRQQQMETPPPDECPMPVLLPVGSGLIATWNVSPTTMKILQKELRRGFKTVKQVELGRVHWSDVYNSARFFQRHRHYLEFACMASSPEIFEHWHVWAKKKVQTIVRLFESTSNDIVSLRPWPQWLDFKDAKWPHAHAIFIGLHLERGKDGQNDGGRRSFDLREPIVKFLEATATWPDAERYANQFELEIRHIKNDQLQTWLDNRQKGIVAHGQAMPLTGGLQMQALGEKVSVCELPLGDASDPVGDSM